ncbi:MAG: hypothetical protein ACK42E_00085, partial [Candidatus Bipolaricaulaceae bacterium]
VLSHLLRGHLRLYQCYTNVTWRTCEVCLSWHGRILARPGAFAVDDGCVHEVLSFPVWQLPRYRQKGQRMRARAEEELRRRSWWQEGVNLLPTQPQEALDKFAQAAEVDLYIAELEALVAQHGPWLREQPEIRRAMRDLFLTAWKAKFAKERYERQPEQARMEQEKWGLGRIKELLA